MRRYVIGLLVAAALVAGVTGFGQTLRADKSLYDRLGGRKAIAAVVDEFVGRVAADKRITHFFTATAADAK